jgi:hypothetical protein
MEKVGKGCQKGLIDFVRCQKASKRLLEGCQNIWKWEKRLNERLERWKKVQQVTTNCITSHTKVPIYKKDTERHGMGLEICEDDDEIIWKRCRKVMTKASKRIRCRKGTKVMKEF